ncbi:uncharacterized protein [Apostichopus japonicus]|uniref:uncharacterized protein n=1 Tax=Stichopus japonicus TaxID=307972 RepID=UPI003AB81B3A
MGCGSSTDSVKSESKASLGTAVSSRASSSTRTPTLRNKARVAPEAFIDTGTPTLAKKQVDDQSRDSGIDSAKTTDGGSRESEAGDTVNSKIDAINNHKDNQVLKKAVAFDVTLGDGQVESIIGVHPPRRLQKLENSPRPILTLEELDKRQKKSEARRKKALEKKATSSQRSSRRRNDLIAAVKFSQEHQQQVTARKLEEKIDSANKSRDKHQMDMVMKQKIRESKAKQAREKRLRASMDEDEYDVEKDETYNVDDDEDSWLDGENNVDTTTQFKGSASTTASERIYDGRSSPAKRMYGGGMDQRLGYSKDLDSDESETEAFSARNVVQVSKNNNETDDFFD